MDAEQKKLGVATLSNWFSPTEQPPDSGEIDCHHTLLALLHRIRSRRLTGKLQLVFGRVEKVLFFDAGELVFATSSDREDGLGEVMLRAGALTQSQFEEASTLVETGQRFGSAIAEMGVTGVEEIITWSAPPSPTSHRICTRLSCRPVPFLQLLKNVVPEIGITLPMEKLLLEAVRKANDLPLDRLAEDADFRVELSSDPLRPFKPEDLEDGERRLLGLISQPISAKDLASQSALPRPQASRALYGLLLLGFVVGVPDSVKPEGTPVVPRPPTALEEPPFGQTQATSESASAEDMQLLTGVAKSQAEESRVRREESKAVEALSAANIPQQQSVEAPTLAEGPGAVDAPRVASNAEPQPAATPAQAQEVKAVKAASTTNTLEQMPAFPVPEEGEASETLPRGTSRTSSLRSRRFRTFEKNRKKLKHLPRRQSTLKPNMISREVQVRATGIPPEKNELGRQLFNEERLLSWWPKLVGDSVVCRGDPGQLLVLANVETKREVIVGHYGSEPQTDNLLSGA